MCSQIQRKTLKIFCFSNWTNFSKLKMLKKGGIFQANIHPWSLLFRICLVCVEPCEEVLSTSVLPVRLDPCSTTHCSHSVIPHHSEYVPRYPPLHCIFGVPDARSEEKVIINAKMAMLYSQRYPWNLHLNKNVEDIVIFLV